MPSSPLKKGPPGLESVPFGVHYSTMSDSSPAPADNGEKICYCFEVYEKTIEQAVRAFGLRTVDEVKQATKAGCGCHTCHPEIEEILARCARGTFRFPAGNPAPLPPALRPVRRS